MGQKRRCIPPRVHVKRVGEPTLPLAAARANIANPATASYAQETRGLRRDHRAPRGLVAFMGIHARGQ